MALVRPLVTDVQGSQRHADADRREQVLRPARRLRLRVQDRRVAQTGTYSDPNSAFEVEITLNADGSIDFVSNLPVDAVFIKGGNEGGNLYVYDPA